jgi:hypothetical protein
MEQPSAETAAAVATEDTAGTPSMPGHDAPTLPLAVSEEPQAPAQLASPPALVAQPRLTDHQAPAAADTLTGQLPRGQEAIPAPAVAGATSELPASEQPATATREQPLFQPPMPSDYDRMMPPAAGRMAPETPVAPGPAKQLQGQAAERAPAAGYYGRPMPPAGPAYNYQAPGYPYQSGAPGYWNMPAYGYPRGQTRPEEQYVPPPPVYDSMQYQQAPMQGYR